MSFPSASPSSSSLLSLSSTTATNDMLGTMFRITNNAIEQGVNTSNFTLFTPPFEYLEKVSNEAFHRYINEGSYYPALSFAMRRGEFEKVLNALRFLDRYPRFITQDIRLCKAACLFQLKQGNEFAEYVDNLQDYGVHQSLRHLIITKQLHEKRAYEELLFFFKNTNSESP